MKTCYVTNINGIFSEPTNGFRARFLGFSVYISNTTDKLQGVLCFKDDAFTLDTIPSVLTVTCPVHGQYVIYYNERLSAVTYPNNYAHNELCEVEVYGPFFVFLLIFFEIIKIYKIELFVKEYH